MNTIKELFDSSKDINRRIESVVTFADNSEENLKNEINEYVVTDKLHDNYEKVIEELESAFRDSSNEVGVWVSGFYGSGKSSFAKYLGYSFQQSLKVDGISFGEKLMNRIEDNALKTLHRAVIQKYDPLVIMIDLTTEATAGITSTVSDIMYYETLKLIGIKATDPKLMDFISILQEEGKYDQFCEMVKAEGKDWEVIQSKKLIANKYAAKFAPIILPEYFSSSEEYNAIKVESVEDKTDRFKRLCSLVKQKYGKERIIYVLDEIGQYVGGSEDLIRSMQGTMQILKSQFKGNVWLIGTAQQTLTEDNPQAQVNSDKLFKLNDRFPIKVDIEADDIKEIITKRLLGKSPQGKEVLTALFNRNEASIKLETRLTNMERSLYMKPLTSELFANLYPFLPVHIDILLALLQKLASRSGGSGLRSVIRLIRDLLVDGHLAECPLGKMATPDLFYDALHPYMEKNQDFREIVISAKKAIELYSSNPLAVKVCKTIAIMQLLDDFCLSFDNLCSLLFQQIGHPLSKPELRALLDEIKDTAGVTLQEIDGRFRFMTNAILSVQDERSRINATDSDKFKVMKELVHDILSPAPSVSIYGSKTISATVELCRGRQNPVLIPGGDIKLNVRFVDASDFEKVHNALLTESTKVENKQTMFWVCTLPQDIELLLIDVVRDETICNNHRHDTNKEIQDYLRAQQADADKNRQEITRILRQSQNNSETICKGSPTSVNGETYKTQALKSFAEQVYNKYPLASRSMSASVVSDLLAYEDSTKLPESLNPFGIVGDNGVIETGHAAFAEIKDYIASNNDANGGQLSDHFSRAQYGWSKDTIRYLVALMLKAGIIVVRSGAQSFKMFTKNAAEAMKNNTSFSHLGLSLNTDAHLKPAEMMMAMTTLKELYNPQGLSPIPASIAKISLKIATQRRTKVEQLKDTFEKLKMAGTSIVSQAVNYLVKIIESEGAEAPYLFAKDKACADALRFVNLVFKAEEQGKVITSIKKIQKRLNDAQRLPQLPTLEILKNQLGEDEQAFNDIMLDPICFNHTAEYADLASRIDNEIEQACMHFYTEATLFINQKNSEIRGSEDFCSLKEEQKQSIEVLMSKIAIQEGKTLELLQEMCNQFTAFYAPLGLFDSLERKVKDFVAANKSAVTTPAEDDDTNRPNESSDETDAENASGANEPTPTVVRRQIKRRLTQRKDVESLINELTRLLPQMDEGVSIDLSFID